MKRILLPLLLCLLLVCSACAAAPAAPAQPEQAAPAEQSATPAEPAANPAALVPGAQSSMQTFAFTLDEQTKSATAEDGTVVIEGSYALPVVTLADKAVEQAINRHFTDEREDYDEDFAEYAEDAREHLSGVGKENFSTSAYEYTLSYSAARCDAVVASFIEDSYAYLGGAHGTSTREGVVFDMKTGRDLELEDIVTVSEDAAEKFVVDYLKTALKEKQYTDLGLFEGYEAYLSEIVDEDDCWYMTNDAVVIVINDSYIASHAAGMIEVPIPYADFTILKSEYLPA